MIVLRCIMTNQQITSLITGGNITRWSTFEQAMNQAAAQPHCTVVLLGCDGRFWVPSTPRLARKLTAAGYQLA